MTILHSVALKVRDTTTLTVRHFDEGHILVSVGARGLSLNLHLSADEAAELRAALAPVAAPADVEAA